MRIRYERVAPNVGDIENRSGTRPGFLLQIAEEDGGIIISMLDADKVEPASTSPENHELRYKGIFVGYTEAEEIIAGLREAIHLAKERGRGDLHSGRVRNLEEIL